MDKRRFYESIFQGEKIKIYMDGDPSGGIPVHTSFELPPIKLNLSILESLVAEGKLSQLKEKSLDKFA